MMLLVLPARIATHVVMMIAMKNGAMETMAGAMMIANTVLIIVRRDQGLHNYVFADQTTFSTS